MSILTGAIFAPIDWTNAVIIPLLMSLVIGTLLAIWTGVIVGRLTTFNELRMSAVRALASMYRLVFAKDELDFARLKIEIGYELLNVRIAAIGIRQIRLSDYVGHIRNRVDQLNLRNIHTAISHDGCDDKRVLGERFLDILREDSGTYADMIFGLRADWSPLLTLRKAPDPDETVTCYHPISIPDIEAASRLRTKARSRRETASQTA